MEHRSDKGMRDKDGALQQEEGQPDYLTEGRPDRVSERKIIVCKRSLFFSGGQDKLRKNKIYCSLERRPAYTLFLVNHFCIYIY